MNNVDNQFIFKFSFNKFIFDNYNKYYIRCNFFRDDILYRDKYNNKTFFLINFDEFEKTLRRKKLTYFLLSYYKTFKIFKFNNMKKKINNFDCENFFRHDCDFDFNFNFRILFKTRKN